jgi:uroporphyrinogen decarboxylase
MPGIVYMGKIKANAFAGRMASASLGRSVKMNARERLLAAISGDKPDRVPFTVWHHFYLKPPAGPNSQMAQKELDFYEQAHPDLLKVMHDIEYEPLGPITTPDDWALLDVLDPTHGNFGAQLHTLRQIRAQLDPDVPMIDTVFNTFHYAQKLSDGRLLAQLRDAPDRVHVGLRAITASLAAYAAACLTAGCEGVYFAVSGASAEGATPDEYREHFLPYDRQVLDAVNNSPLTVLHLHGYKDLYFEMTHDLPAAAVCWSDRAGGPSLAEARKLHKGCLMGGLDETRFGAMTTGEIVAQGREAIREMNGAAFILSPGCSVPVDTSVERLQAIEAAVSEKTS